MSKSRCSAALAAGPGLALPLQRAPGITPEIDQPAAGGMRWLRAHPSRAFLAR